MSSVTLRFTVPDGERVEERPIEVSELIIAGWTGRDKAAVEAHIRELEELGVPRPASIPSYYRIAASRLTFAEEIQVTGSDSSGEAEFLLLRCGARLYVGVGSDHTDRKVETYDVAVSKQMCEKPVARELWDFEAVRPHWDQLVLRSWITVSGERVLYQEGSVAALLSPAELIARCGAGLRTGAVMLGGTLPARGGVRPADRFDFELHDPVLGRRILHGYGVSCLPREG